MPKKENGKKSKIPEKYERKVRTKTILFKIVLFIVEN